MANTLITPSTIARMGIATLYAQTQMAGLVHRDFDADFAGKTGDTITVRKPATFTVNEYNRATGIVLQDASEDSTTVTLDRLLDVSFAVTSEDWTLTVNDFRNQFMIPAMEAISQKIDALLIAEANANVPSSVPATDPASYQLVDAGTLLTTKNVPMANRVSLLSPGKANAFIKDPLFHEADKRGDTVGLQEAAIGRKFGFDNYESQNVTPAGTGIAFHRDAFALVTRTLEVPRGVAANQAAVENYKGLGLRVIYNYDSNKKQDVISIDLLAGTKTLDANKAVKLAASA